MSWTDDGGVDAFMRRVEFPSWTESLSMRGEVVYLFTISPEKQLIDYEQVSSMDRSGIPQAIENELENGLTFTSEKGEEIVKCRFVFPIEL